jgi:hypothetical protein
MSHNGVRACNKLEKQYGRLTNFFFIISSVDKGLIFASYQNDRKRLYKKRKLLLRSSHLKIRER